jgi:hypothetical protein
MAHDGENVLFTLCGGQAADPEAVLTSVLDGCGQQQRRRTFRRRLSEPARTW